MTFTESCCLHTRPCSILPHLSSLYHVLPHLTLPQLILSHLIPSHPTPSHPVSSHPILPHLVSPYSISPCPILIHLILSRPLLVLGARPGEEEARRGRAQAGRHRASKAQRSCSSGRGARELKDRALLKIRSQLRAWQRHSISSRQEHYLERTNVEHPLPAVRLVSSACRPGRHWTDLSYPVPVLSVPSTILPSIFY